MTIGDDAKKSSPPPYGQVLTSVKIVVTSIHAPNDAGPCVPGQNPPGLEKQKQDAMIYRSLCEHLAPGGGFPRVKPAPSSRCSHSLASISKGALKAIYRWKNAAPY
jgi:hypothetical protein